MSSSRPFTTGQAAEYCSVSQATIVNWIKDGKLNGYTTPGGHYRIPRADLVSFLRSYGMPIDTDLKQTVRPSLLLLTTNRSIKDLVEKLGKRSGYDTSFVTSDYEASAAAARSKPDAAIIDVDTSSDPIGLCRWLRDNSEDTVVLAVADGGDQVSMQTAGADACLAADGLANLETELEVLLQ